jgi:hypothetical protein
MEMVVQQFWVVSSFEAERGLSSIRSGWMGRECCELGQLALRVAGLDFKSGH